MNKTAIYITVILFLLVTNAATIITTLSINNREKEEDTATSVIELPRDNRVGYFHNQIGLRNEQRPLFNEYNREFNMKAGELSEEMREPQCSVFSRACTI